MRLYVAGSMSAHAADGYNYDAFHHYASLWRSHGYDVLNPAERFGGRTDLPYDVYIKASIIDVLASDAIAMIPGWEESKGASLEYHIAEVLGLPIYQAEYPIRSDERSLRTAGDGLRPSERESSTNGRVVERMACCQEEGMCACR